MDMTPKTVKDSVTVMTEIVLPNDTNNLYNLMGGRLLHWMDICAAIASQRHANQVCVTASVDSVEFNRPIRQGEVVILESRVNRTYRTSMEVQINVWAENNLTRQRRKCNRAFYTFVAIDADGKPKPIPEVIPETDKEKACHANAVKRREFRLLLSGRMKVEDAVHIRSDLMTALKAHADED